MTNSKTRNITRVSEFHANVLWCIIVGIAVTPIGRAIRAIGLSNRIRIAYFLHHGCSQERKVRRRDRCVFEIL